MRIFPALLFLLLLEGSLFVPAGSGEAPAGPKSPSVLDRVQELLKNGHFDQARDALSSYAPAAQELAVFHYLNARTLEQLNRAHESIEHYRLAYLYASSDKDRKRFLIARADAYLKIGYMQEAALSYDVFLVNFPKTPEAEQVHARLARARFSLGQYREALRHYEMTGALSVESSYGRANTLQALGMFNDASALYASLMGKDTAFLNSSVETKYYLGENFRVMNMISDAKIYLNLVQDPAFRPRAEIGLGLIALKEGATELAARYFTSAAESTDRAVRQKALLHGAEAYLKSGKPDSAVASLLEIRNDHPFSAQYNQAMVMLASIYRSRGKTQDSLVLLKELIYQRQPDPAALDALEAIMLEALRKDTGELPVLWAAAGSWLLDPARSQSVLKIAQGLTASGTPLLEICRWLLKYGQENEKTEARLLLADFYAAVGDAASAYQYLKRAEKKLEGGRIDYFLRVAARVYAANNDSEKTAAAIMSLDYPGEQDIILLLEAAGKKGGDESILLAYAKRVLESVPAGPRTYVRLADLLYETGRKQEALRYYSLAFETSGAKPEEQDRSWAGYRLAKLTGRHPAQTGANRAAPQSRRSGNRIDRVAEADMKGKEISARLEKVL